MPSLIQMQKKRRKLPISLTSLIDVVFILLIFFMLATRFEKEAAVVVDLPESAKTTMASSNTQPLHLELLPNGSFDLSGSIYQKEYLKQYLLKNLDRNYTISVDEKASTQDLVAFMDLASEVELGTYRFLTEKKVVSR